MLLSRFNQAPALSKKLFGSLTNPPPQCPPHLSLSRRRKGRGPLAWEQRYGAIVAESRHIQLQEERRVDQHAHNSYANLFSLACPLLIFKNIRPTAALCISSSSTRCGNSIPRSTWRCCRCVEMLLMRWCFNKISRKTFGNLPNFSSPINNNTQQHHHHHCSAKRYPHAAANAGWRCTGWRGYRREIRQVSGYDKKKIVKERKKREAKWNETEPSSLHMSHALTTTISPPPPPQLYRTECICVLRIP